MDTFNIDREINLAKIELEIENKKKLLLKKRKDLEEKQGINMYLSDVRQDYTKYHKYIVDEKKKQYESLLLLKEYMDQLIQTDNMLNKQFIMAKSDQDHIMYEIDKIKTELDGLTIN
jgi:hypothetical protein